MLPIGYSPYKNELSGWSSPVTLTPLWKCGLRRGPFGVLE